MTTRRPREVRASIIFPDESERRLSFVEGARDEDGSPMVFVYSRASAFGGYRTARYGDRLGRAWVRAWAASAAPGAMVRF